MTIDTTAYKKQLEEMRAVMHAELATLGVQNPDLAEDWVATAPAQTGESDPNDAADRVEDWEERRSTLAELETRYNNIKRALQKITDGTYGACEVCGSVIELARLAANPAARTCTTHLEEVSAL